MDFYRKIDARKRRGQWNIRFLLSIFFTFFRIYSIKFKVRVQIVNWIFFNLSAYYYATTFYKN